MWSAWLLIVISVVIVTGNAITIVIFTSSSRLRMRRYLLIINLAIADLLVGLISIPMYISWVLNPNATKAYITAYVTQDSLFGIASLYGLAGLAIERAYATYYPFKHRVLSKVPYSAGIAGIWMFALLSSSVVFAFFGQFPTVIIVAILLIPLAAVIIAYILVWIKVTYHRPIHNHAIHQSNAKLTVTLGIVTLVTLIAWIPFTIVSLKPAVLTSPDGFVFLCVTKWLEYGNSMVNIVIYAVRMRGFKQEIVRKMRCCRTRLIVPSSRMNKRTNNIELNVRNDDDNSHKEQKNHIFTHIYHCHH